jgi:hypothetical protein
VLEDPPNLRGFGTHVQNATPPGGAPINTLSSDSSIFITEDEFLDAPLSAFEQRDLAQICSFVRYLGTGRGRCDEECTEK